MFLRVLLISRYDVEEMINEVEGRKILESFRGRPKADVEAVVDILLKVSKFSMDLKESVLEMDLNPIIVQSEGNGAKVVDSRFIVCRNI